MRTTKGSVEEYVARGGSITTCAPREDGTIGSAREDNARLFNGSQRPDGSTGTDRQIRQSNIGFTRWLRQLIHDDTYGLYLAFALTPAQGYSVERTRFALHRNIDKLNARYMAHPHSSHAQIKRRGVMVFDVPAISSKGRKHLHGIVRLPVQMCADRVPTQIKHGTFIDIDAPAVVRSDLFRTRYGRAIDKTFVDLHIVYTAVEDEAKNTKRLEMVNLRSRRDIADYRVFEYLAPRYEPDPTITTPYGEICAERLVQPERNDHEWRVFEEGEFYPHFVRRALPNGNTQRRFT